MEISEELYEKMQVILKGKIRGVFSTIEFLMCSKELKKEYILFDKDYFIEDRTIGLIQYENIDQDLQELCITRLIRNNRCLKREFFDVTSEDNKQYYLTKLIPTTIKVTNEIFDYMTDTQKLEYIMHRGFDRLGNDILDWYGKWKVAKGRDVKIENIFLG